MQRNATNEPRGVEWGEWGWLPIKQPCQFTGPGMVVQGRYVNLWLISLKTNPNPNFPKSFPINYSICLAILIIDKSHNVCTPNFFNTIIPQYDYSPHGPFSDFLPYVLSHKYFNICTLYHISSHIITQDYFSIQN